MGEVVALVSAFFWVISTILLRPILGHAGLFATNALRFVFGAILFILIGLFTGRLGDSLALSTHIYVLIALTAFISLVIAETLYYFAVRTIGVVRTLPISASYPLLTAVMAVAFLGEPGGWGLFTGGVSIVLGTTVLGLPTAAKPLNGVPSVANRRQALAILLTVVAAVGFATSSLITKIVILESDPIIFAIVRHMFASAVCMSIAVPFRGFAGAWPRGRWLALTAIAGATTVVALAMFAVAIDLIGAARTTLLTGVGPLFALPFAFYVLHERITRRTMAGVLATVAGIMLVVQR